MGSERSISPRQVLGRMAYDVGKHSLLVATMPIVGMIPCKQREEFYGKFYKYCGSASNAAGVVSSIAELGIGAKLLTTADGAASVYLGIGLLTDAVFRTASTALTDSRRLFGSPTVRAAYESSKFAYNASRNLKNACVRGCKSWYNHTEEKIRQERSLQDE